MSLKKIVSGGQTGEVECLFDEIGNLVEPTRPGRPNDGIWASNTVASADAGVSAGP
jgi:hypothetical protein